MCCFPKCRHCQISAHMSHIHISSKLSCAVSWICLPTENVFAKYQQCVVFRSADTVRYQLTYHVFTYDLACIISQISVSHVMPKAFKSSASFCAVTAIPGPSANDSSVSKVTLFLSLAWCTGYLMMYFHQVEQKMYICSMLSCAASWICLLSENVFAKC